MKSDGTISLNAKLELAGDDSGNTRLRVSTTLLNLVPRVLSPLSRNGGGVEEVGPWVRVCLNLCCIRELKGPFTRAIFVAIFLILTHAIELLSHKSIDSYSFAQMV